MQNINERPVCHRAEDLVTYLYGEATAEEARDFSAHMQQCDACRAEFTVFNQVHTSIVSWRQEALGGVAVEAETSPAAESIVSATGFVRPRKLSAVAALREFFSVAPLWLRGATAFAGLLLCALIGLAIVRTWQQPSPVASARKYSEEEFQQAVQKEVAEQVAKRTEVNREQSPAPVVPKDDGQPRDEVVVHRPRPKTQPANRLTRQEREQLAADLGLIPLREEEQPFVFPDGDEPND